MKRTIITALAVASLLAGTNAHADQKSCMKWCMEEYKDFAYCQKICSGSSATTPSVGVTEEAKEDSAAEKGVSYDDFRSDLDFRKSVLQRLDWILQELRTKQSLGCK